MRDQVLVAERAVLYTVSFQLRIKTPYPEILMLQHLAPEQHKHDLLNIAWSLVNDSLQTTLSLVYPPEKIAATAFFLAHEIHGLPLPNRDGRGFCELVNITTDELRGESPCCCCCCDAQHRALCEPLSHVCVPSFCTKDYFKIG